MSELTEAKGILERLTTAACRLSVQERRFVETWSNYLATAGDRAQFGKWRMQSLRRVAAAYGFGEAQHVIEAGFRR